MEKPTEISHDPSAPDLFRRILLEHNRKYPRWQAEDVYKLILQAAMGSEHAVKDIAAVQKWMERELATMGDGPEEPLTDPIRPDKRILRIHLRPYVAKGGDPQRLMEAFITTANQFTGIPDDLERYWATARQLAFEGTLQINPEKMEEFFNEARKQGFPAHEHSVIFEDLYRPAYRIVAMELVASLHLPK